MSQLMKVEQLNGVEVVDTRTVAEELGIQHKNLLETIAKYLPEIENAFGAVAFKTDTDYQQVTGIERKECGFLTEDQALFVSTLSRNSQQVVQFKARLVQAFQAARKFIQEVTKPVSKEALWLEALNSLTQEVEMQKEQLQLANATIEKQAPAVMYATQVLQSHNCYTTTTIAKELGMGAPSLNQLLKDLNIQYKHDGHWVLYQQHQNKGYTQTRTHTYYDSENKQQTSLQTVWTEKGRAYIHKRINQYKATA